MDRNMVTFCYKYRNREENGLESNTGSFISLAIKRLGIISIVTSGRDRWVFRRWGIARMRGSGP